MWIKRNGNIYNKKNSSEAYTCLIFTFTLWENWLQAPYCFNLFPFIGKLSPNSHDMLLNLREWGGKRLENRREIWLSHVACHCTVLYPFFSQISRHFIWFIIKTSRWRDQRDTDLQHGKKGFLNPLIHSFWVH